MAVLSQNEALVALANYSFNKTQLAGLALQGCQTNGLCKDFEPQCECLVSKFGLLKVAPDMAGYSKRGDDLFF